MPDFGKDGKGQIYHSAKLRRPDVFPRVVQQASLRVDDVRAEIACHPRADVVFGEHEAADLRVAFRLVLLDPEQLRKRPGRRRHLHAYAEYLAAVVGFKAIALVAASLVVPHYARADDLASFVHEDGVVRGSRHR